MQVSRWPIVVAMEWPRHKTQGCGKGKKLRRDTEIPANLRTLRHHFSVHIVMVQPEDKVAACPMKDRCKGLEHFLNLTDSVYPRERRESEPKNDNNMEHTLVD